MPELLIDEKTAAAIRAAVNAYVTERLGTLERTVAESTSRLESFEKRFNDTMNGNGKPGFKQEIHDLQIAWETHKEFHKKAEAEAEEKEKERREDTKKIALPVVNYIILGLIIFFINALSSGIVDTLVTAFYHPKP